MIANNTVNEAVYYMDRYSGVLVTDRQVIVGDHHYELSQVMGASVEQRHSAGCRKLEAQLRAISLSSLLVIFGTYLALRGTGVGSAIFGIAMMILTASLITLVFVGLAGASEQVVVVKRPNGRTEDVMTCRDRRRARLVAQAVREAASDHWNENSPRHRETRRPR